MDYSATTPVDKRVAEKMARYLTMEGDFGNPASRSHYYGWQAEKAVDEARAQVARLVGADPREIVWTSGATESDNLAIKGIAHFYHKRGKHIITLKTEHKAVLDTCRQLEREGFEITYLEPLSNGLLDISVFKDAIREDTILASIMHVNNEIGVIQDIQSIGDICREHKIFFHVDAAQSAGKISIDLASLPVDLMSFSAHKIYGPKGIGALFIKKKNPPVDLELQMDGGGHERGFRSGTLPVALIVGFGKAVKLCSQNRDYENKRLKQYRDQLIDDIMTAHSDVILNGSREQRLSNNLNLCFPGIEAETLIMNMKNIACSTGSACSSASLEPSHVITALGYDTELAHTAIRFSVGRFNNSDEIAAAGKIIINAATASKQKKSNYL